MRQPFCSLRSPSTALQSNVSPGATTVPSMAAAAFRMLNTRFSALCGDLANEVVNVPSSRCLARSASSVNAGSCTLHGASMRVCPWPTARSTAWQSASSSTVTPVRSPVKANGSAAPGR